MIKKLALSLLLLSAPAWAQFATVTASHIQSGPSPLAAGTVQFQAVDGSGNPIGYQVGGGGQQITYPTVCSVTNGVIAAGCLVANTALTNPVNVCLQLTVKDGNNAIVLGGSVASGYGCLQPSTTNIWCSTSGGNTTCNLDNFVPNIAGLPTAVLPPPSPSSIGGIFSGDCTSGQVVQGYGVSGRPDCVAVSGGAGVWGAITGTLTNQTDLTLALGLKAPLASPALTGVPTAPTALLTDNSAAVATTAFVQGFVPAFVQTQNFAPLASPAFTGAPTAPTQLIADSSTKIATTAWVNAQGYSTGSGNVTGAASSGNLNIVLFNGTNGKSIADSGFGFPLSPTHIGTFTAGANGLANSATTDATNATNITSGTLPHAQLPALVSADIPNNTANTTGTSGGLSANIAETQVTNLTTDLAAKAPLASPSLTGVPLAPTPSLADSSTKIATTAFVQGQGFALLASPAFTGAPTAPTPTSSDNTTKIATTAYVQGQAYATLASPNFTGVPTAPTVATPDSSTKIATTAWVNAQGFGTATGDVAGPASSGNTNIALFNGTNGKTIQDAGFGFPLAPAHIGTLVAGTNGLANSATTDTTNAANITSGTLPHARLPALVSGDIPNNAANTTGTAASIAAGAIGSIPYQSGAGATAFVSGNTAATDQALVSRGTGSAAQAPTLSNAPALSAANMTSFPTLNQNTTGTAANLSGTPTLPSGTVLPGYVTTTTTVNSHALSGNVTVSASDLTTGTLPHAQLPALLSGDIPNNAANTSGTAGGLSANIVESQVTNLPADLAAKAPIASPSFTGAVTLPQGSSDTAPGIQFLNTNIGIWLASNPATWTVTNTSNTSGTSTLTITSSSGFTFNTAVGEYFVTSGIGGGYDCALPTPCQVTAFNAGAGTLSYTNAGSGAFSSGSLHFIVMKLTQPGARKLMFNSLISSTANPAQTHCSLCFATGDSVNYHDTTLNSDVLLMSAWNGAGTKGRVQLGDLPGTVATAGAIVPGTFEADGAVTLGAITGSTQCLHASSSGVVTGTGTDCGAGGGNVTGPGSSSSGNVATYNNTTGTLLQDSGIASANLVTQTSNGAANQVATYSGANKVLVPSNSLNLSGSVTAAAFISPGGTVGIASTVPSSNPTLTSICGSTPGFPCSAFTVFSDGSWRVNVNASSGSQAWLGPLVSHPTAGACASGTILTGTGNTGGDVSCNTSVATGTTGSTATALDNSTKLATTAYADAAVAVETSRATTAEALKAPLASPALTGTPTVPTATAGTNTTQAASTAFVLANSIQGVTAGTGLTGGGSSGTPTVSLSTPVSAANGGLGGTVTGIIKGNGSSAAGAALAADVIGLFATCSGTQYLGADGACHTASGGALPSGTQGLPLINTTGSNSYATSGLFIDASQLSGATLDVQLNKANALAITTGVSEIKAQALGGSQTIAAEVDIGELQPPGVTFTANNGPFVNGTYLVTVTLVSSFANPTSASMEATVTTSGCGTGCSINVTAPTYAGTATTFTPLITAAGGANWTEKTCAASANTAIASTATVTATCAGATVSKVNIPYAVYLELPASATWSVTMTGLSLAQQADATPCALKAFDQSGSRYGESGEGRSFVIQAASSSVSVNSLFCTDPDPKFVASYYNWEGVSVKDAPGDVISSALATISQTFDESRFKEFHATIESGNTGTVNTQNAASGGCTSNCVTWVSGPTFPPGIFTIEINGAEFSVSSWVSATLISLQTAPGTQTAVASAFPTVGVWVYNTCCSTTIPGLQSEGTNLGIPLVIGKTGQTTNSTDFPNSSIVHPGQTYPGIAQLVGGQGIHFTGTTYTEGNATACLADFVQMGVVNSGSGPLTFDNFRSGANCSGTSAYLYNLGVNNHTIGAFRAGTTQNGFFTNILRFPGNTALNVTGATANKTYPLIQYDSNNPVNMIGTFVQGVGTARVAANFTTAANTNFQTITGLSWTMPPSAAALSYVGDCDLDYTQATGTAVVAFGIQAATNAPTNINGRGVLYTAAGSATTAVLHGLATTTATAIVTGTPAATGTNNLVRLSFTVENPAATANTLNVMVSTATAADAVTVARGGECKISVAGN